MRLDKNSVSPIYVQIAEGIEDDILDGILPEDTQAYSQYQIAKLLGINPATAAKGINLLVQKGFLYKVRGMGMYVSKGARKKIMSERKKSFLKTMVQELIAEAKKLEISRNELTQMIYENMEGSVK
jgi:DNA-binding transcriptional regulator YhcF (GntR family)